MPLMLHHPPSTGVMARETGRGAERNSFRSELRAGRGEGELDRIVMNEATTHEVLGACTIFNASMTTRLERNEWPHRNAADNVTDNATVTCRNAARTKDAVA
jgi:hypothetical protein